MWMCATCRELRHRSEVEPCSERDRRHWKCARCGAGAFVDDDDADFWIYVEDLTIFAWIGARYHAGWPVEYCTPCVQNHLRFEQILNAKNADPVCSGTTAEGDPCECFCRSLRD